MYRVKDWEAIYETPESRRLKNTRYVCVPNKMDGKGFRRIQLHPRRVDLFCAWNLIVQVASKCPTRGVLVDRDGPITPADMELKTGFPAELFVFAFDFFTSGEKLAWLEKSPEGPGGCWAPTEIHSNPQQLQGAPRNGDSAPDSQGAQQSPASAGNPQQSPARGEEKEERRGEREDARARTTQAHADRALQVLRSYPDRASKDNRPIAKDTYAQDVLAARIAKHPDYPWEEHARLEGLNPTPRNAHTWALAMPDPVALEALRNNAAAAAPARRQL